MKGLSADQNRVYKLRNTFTLDAFTEHFRLSPNIYPDHPPTSSAMQTSENEIDRIQKYVETTLGHAGSHGLDHTLRVADLCREIGRAEGADMRVLIPAAFFHDIARPLEEEKGVPHEEGGARIAEEYLGSIGYDETLVQAIVHAIRAHRYSTGAAPETLEAKVLSDADKLDAMGAVGLARTFLQAGEHEGGIQDAIDHIHDKLLKLHGLMYTQTARNMAEKRHALLCLVVEALEDEMRPRR